jgi:DNA polymerase/3'-5' exonuclease PolX
LEASPHLFLRPSFHNDTEGNRNAGGAYTRVVNAIKGLELEITADNAMSLSKGKTKIPNIGKASAEKMKEYMETGTIQKLEEKRADNA